MKLSLSVHVRRVQKTKQSWQKPPEDNDVVVA